jgi:hypothetical protein
MAKHRMTVDDHYSRGRTHPHGRVVDDGAENQIRRMPSTESGNSHGAWNRPDVQDPEDRLDAKYRNDHSDDWVRGRAEDATGKPGFDRGNSWRLGREKSLDWHSGSDPAILRKPVGEK